MTEVRAGSSEVRATATEELLPCPFCGGEVRLQDFDHLNTRTGKYVHEWAFWHDCPPMGKHRNVYGQGTGAMVIDSAYFETREEAIAAWNRRAK